MNMRVAVLMSLLAAQTLRRGGDFAAPDLAEERILAELENESAP